MYDEMVINVLENDVCCQDEDEDNIVYDLHLGVDWDVPLPANTLLFAAGWGSFGLSPIL